MTFEFILVPGSSTGQFQYEAKLVRMSIVTNKKVQKSFSTHIYKELRRGRKRQKSEVMTNSIAVADSTARRRGFPDTTAPGKIGSAAGFAGRPKGEARKSRSEHRARSSDRVRDHPPTAADRLDSSPRIVDHPAIRRPLLEHQPSDHPRRGPDDHPSRRGEFLFGPPMPRNPGVPRAPGV